MSELFEYALLRVVPRPERGEYINAGVVLYCPALGFLDARVHLDAGRLRALDPRQDPEAVLEHLRTARRICAGGSGAGAVGRLSARQRFGRVVALRSTVVQSSPIHTGFTDDPEEKLEHLLRIMVHPPEEECS